jgi:topoisomerase-4 subunit A
LDENAVELKPTYDGLEEEPAVLPSAFPNLLANGASGIAVGMATSIPPHNVGELCDALLALLANPNTTIDKLVSLVPGPDFPTGGQIVDSRASIIAAYRSGRGSFRLRAVWEKEDRGRGLWRAVVTEIPYQVQKSKLIERLADLVTSKKVPILGDVVDESAEDVRIIIEPRAKTVDPTLLMETLFRMSDLEVKIPLNMNVLRDGRTPEVLSLSEVLTVFLDHRRDVLERRAQHRLAKVNHRLEVLGGYLIAYLNLDRVIEIIRNEDEPKPILMTEFSLTDVQVEAMLNMRLRSLRRLEEMQIKGERDALRAERKELINLLDDRTIQWRKVANEIRDLQKKFGKSARHGARRSGFGEAVQLADTPLEATTLREPITVICSEKGWIRAQKGHAELDSEFKYKDGDARKFVLHAETTDKLLLFASNGRVFTLSCDKLPGGRGMGEPVRLMIELGEAEEIIELTLASPNAKRILASSQGRGFMVSESEIMAQTRTGKQVLVLDGDAKLAATTRVAGDLVAVVGENRKMIIFDIGDLPEMNRGKGVILQRYKQGGLRDVTTCSVDTGLRWEDPAGRTRTALDLSTWKMNRAGQGAAAPRGFPKNGRFR